MFHINWTESILSAISYHKKLSRCVICFHVDKKKIINMRIYKNISVFLVNHFEFTWRKIIWASAITWHRFLFFSDNDSRVCGVRTFLVKVKICSSTLSNQIMKRKFEQWCLTIQTITTKRTNNFKNLHSFASTHRKTSHGHTKQNDNISMESTLAGPMNARS